MNKLISYLIYVFILKTLLGSEEIRTSFFQGVI